MVVASHKTGCLQQKRNLLKRHYGAHRLATKPAEPGSEQLGEARNRT